MSYTETDKLKALAVVNIFETGRAFGDYAAVAVLNDDAGISYGINQFTHRSGSLAAVVARYFDLGGTVGRRVIKSRENLLQKKNYVAVTTLEDDEMFKKALRAAAVTREMRIAQTDIALERYLKPALDICETKRFALPLSLAVVYDSVTHGSFEKIAQRIQIGKKIADEKTWITGYVRERDKWLASVPRLKKTRYRTQFFLKQIMTGRWGLELPLEINGVRLNEDAFPREPFQRELPFDQAATSDAADNETNAPGKKPTTIPAEAPPQTLPYFSETSRPQTRTVPAEPPAVGSGGRQQESVGESCLDKAEEAVNAAAAKYDQAERIVNTVITRRDAAKSLWTTVAGTIWQTVWGLAGFLSGMPRTVWFVVAVIAGALMIGYLYRQIELGRIREKFLIAERDQGKN